MKNDIKGDSMIFNIDLLLNDQKLMSNGEK
jgi:hypothetical protein